MRVQELQTFLTAEGPLSNSLDWQGLQPLQGSFLDGASRLPKQLLGSHAHPLPPQNPRPCPDSLNTRLQSQYGLSILYFNQKGSLLYRTSDGKLLSLPKMKSVYYSFPFLFKITRLERVQSYISSLVITRLTTYRARQGYSHSHGISAVHQGLWRLAEAVQGDAPVCQE